MSKLNEIDEFTYRSLTNILFEMVPDYKLVYNNLHKDEVGVNCYLFMNEYSTFLSNEITKDTTSIFVNNSFKYINYLSTSNNMEVLNLLKIGILEILYTESEIIRKKTNDLLNEKNKMMFASLSLLYR